MYKKSYPRNRKVLSQKNTSGLNGVSYNKAAKKWAAYIFINKKRKFLGHFETKEEAAEARVAAGGVVYLKKRLYCQPTSTSKIGTHPFDREKAEADWNNA